MPPICVGGDQHASNMCRRQSPLVGGDKKTHKNNRCNSYEGSPILSSYFLFWESCFTPGPDTIKKSGAWIGAQLTILCSINRKLRSGDYKEIGV